MKIVAYAVAFFIGPTLGVAGKVAMFPLLWLIRGHRVSWIIIRGIGSVLSGVLTIWIGKWVFSWFGYPPTILMGAVIALGFVIVDTRRPSDDWQSGATHRRDNQ